MNKYFIHKPKIKIIYIVGLRSLLAKKIKNQKLHITILKMSVPRSRSFFI